MIKTDSNTENLQKYRRSPVIGLRTFVRNSIETPLDGKLSADASKHVTGGGKINILFVRCENKDVRLDHYRSSFVLFYIYVDLCAYGKGKEYNTKTSFSSSENELYRHLSIYPVTNMHLFYSTLITNLE